MLTTRRDWLKRQILTRVLIHTTDGGTVEGILDVAARDGVVLRSPKYHEGETEHSLQGTAFIPRERVGFVQVLTEGPA